MVENFLLVWCGLGVLRPGFRPPDIGLNGVAAQCSHILEQCLKAVNGVPSRGCFTPDFGFG